MSLPKKKEKETFSPSFFLFFHAWLTSTGEIINARLTDFFGSSLSYFLFHHITWIIRRGSNEVFECMSSPPNQPSVPFPLACHVPCSYVRRANKGMRIRTAAEKGEIRSTQRTQATFWSYVFKRVKNVMWEGNKKVSPLSPQSVFSSAVFDPFL